VLTLIIGGAACLISGLAMVLAPSTMEGLVLAVVGAIFLACGVLWAYRVIAFEATEHARAGALRAFAAGVALMAGSLSLVAEFSSLVDAQSVGVAVSIAAILIGLAGLSALWLRSGFQRMMSAVTLVDVMLVAVGIVGMIQAHRHQSLIQTAGWMLLIVGSTLLTIGVFRRRNETRALGTGEA